MVMKEEPTNCAAVRNIGESTKERKESWNQQKQIKEEKKLKR